MENNHTVCDKSDTGIPSGILDDLSSRFIINIPEKEKKDLIRIFFQIELAHWYYIDFYCQKFNDCKPCGMKEFALYIFKHIPFLSPRLKDLDKLIEEWRDYKFSVPTYGAILLDDNLTHVLLVQSYWSRSSWGFPKGKVNKDEAPCHCAIREVYEETGFNITKLIDQDEYVEAHIHDQLVKLYIIPGISRSTYFEPRTRNEIKAINWFLISDLPLNRKDTSKKTGINSNSFYMVTPFLRNLRRWIVKHSSDPFRRLRRHRYKSCGDIESLSFGLKDEQKNANDSDPTYNSIFSAQLSDQESSSENKSGKENVFKTISSMKIVTDYENNFEIRISPLSKENSKHVNSKDGDQIQPKSFIYSGFQVLENRSRPPVNDLNHSDKFDNISSSHVKTSLRISKKSNDYNDKPNLSSNCKKKSVSQIRNGMPRISSYARLRKIRDTKSNNRDTSSEDDSYENTSGLEKGCNAFMKLRNVVSENYNVVDGLDVFSDIPENKINKRHSISSKHKKRELGKKSLHSSKLIQNDTCASNLKTCAGLPEKTNSICHSDNPQTYSLHNANSLKQEEAGKIIVDGYSSLRNSFQSFSRLKCKEEFEFMKLSYRMKKIEVSAWSNFKFDLNKICDTKDFF